MKRSFALLVVVGVSLLVPVSGAANPFELYGSGGRGAATADAQAATTQGPHALFYNVAGLAGSELEITGGFTASVNRARILLHERPSGYDIPDLGNRSPAVPSGAVANPRRDTRDIDPLYAFTLGAVTSFGIEDFRAGLLFAIPTSGYVDANTYFADERERIYSNQLHFALIDRRVRRMDIELGVAYRVAPWLRAGLGAAFAPGSKMTTQAFIPNVADQANVDLNTDVDTESNWGLTAGVLFDITEAFHLGLSYRNEVYFRIHGENHIRLGTDGEDGGRVIEQEIDWVPSYSPDTVTAGLAYEVAKWRVLADARYLRWSDFRNPHNQPTDFDDIVSPRLGVEYALSTRSKLRGGVGWAPSPVPDQNGRTNYVDNDRALASAGASYRFDAFDQPLRVDWALRLQLLVERTTHKEVREGYPNCEPGADSLCDEVPDDTSDPRTGQPYREAQGLQTGNPGFPGFTSGGWLGAVVVEFSWLPEEEG